MCENSRRLFSYVASIAFVRTNAACVGLLPLIPHAYGRNLKGGDFYEEQTKQS